MSLAQFIDTLLHNNELYTLPEYRPEGVSGPLTDSAIKNSIKAEFPLCKTALDVVNDKIRVTIGSFRSRYNNLVNKNHDRYPLISLRYDRDGYPVKTYEHPLRLDEIREKCCKYGIIDPRFFSLAELQIIKDNYLDVNDIKLFPSEIMIEKFPFGTFKLKQPKELDLDDHWIKLERFFLPS